jgi:hypothetical protein
LGGTQSKDRPEQIGVDDVDIPIELGNDKILENEEDDFGKSDDSYLSAEEDDVDKYA